MREFLKNLRNAIASSEVKVNPFFNVADPHNALFVGSSAPQIGVEAKVPSCPGFKAKASEPNICQNCNTHRRNH